MRLLSFVLCLSLAVPAAAERARVLLLDYGAPAVHDVLQSYLCVEPCTHDAGCPEELVRSGADAWSGDFVVYRPPYVGTSAAFVVRAFKDRGVVLLSFAGAHDAGYGEGSFDPWSLEDEIAGIDGAELFFTEPKLVFLNGVGDDEPPELMGDPEAWLRRIAETGRVVPADVDPFLWAMELLSGTPQLYRVLFPNACLAGFDAPEDGEDVRKAVDGVLRRIARHETGTEVAEEGAGCPDGWPCNLCRAGGARHRALAGALASFLRGEARGDDGDEVFGEAAFDRAGDACPGTVADASPAFSNPAAAAPFARLFVELLWLETDELETAERTLYYSELVDRLGPTELVGLPAIELRAWVHNPRHWEKLDAFVRGPLLKLSSFRQRDLFTFFASLRCGDCLELAMAEDVPSILRENAARRLVPELGAGPYRRALADPDPRVRHAAADRLGAGLDPELLREAAEHSDPEVRRLAARATGR